MRRESHVRFGGRAGETDRSKDQHRAPARPNTLVSVAHGFLTLERLRHPKSAASA
jgi:hypothetical protein